jgi:hypothetical protein
VRELLRCQNEVSRARSQGERASAESLCCFPFLFVLDAAAESSSISAAANQENRRSLLGVKKEKKVVKKGKDGVNQASSAANQGDDVGENNQAASGACW